MAAAPGEQGVRGGRGQERRGGPGDLHHLQAGGGPHRPAHARHRRAGPVRGGAPAEQGGAGDHHHCPRLHPRGGGGDPAGRVFLPDQAHRGRGPAARGGKGPAGQRRRGRRDGGSRGVAAGHHLSQRGDGGTAVAGPAGGRDRLHRAHPRRERHRQGTAGHRHPPGQRLPRRAVHPGQLHRHPGVAARIRAVRPRQGLVHRRGEELCRPVPVGPQRHPVPRRDRRHAAAHPGQAAARAPGPADPAGGQFPAGAGERAHHLGHPPQPRGGDQGTRLPRGSLLPAQRGQPGTAAPAPAAGGHPAAGRAFCRPAHRQGRGPGKAVHARGHAGAGRGALAGQHPPAVQRGRERGGPGHLAPDHRGPAR